MTTFSFTGFTAGSSVALSAAQGGVIGNGSVAVWGINTNMGSLSILTRRADHLFAPSAVWLEATEVSGFDVEEGGDPVYDPSFHEITYIWTVRGQPLAPFEALENMVSGWNNPNVMYGKKVAFHFPQAGAYTIDLWAIDSNGTTGVAETAVVVQDESAADARYAGTRTICFSSSGDFTGAPAGARLITVSSGNDINNETDSAINVPTRLLFRRGDTFENATMFVRDQLEYVGAFGTGLRPVLTSSPNSSIFKSGSGSQHTITGLECRDGWDSTTETGSYMNSGPMFFRSTNTVARVLVSDCVFDGFNTIETTIGSSSANGSMLIFADTVVTNWRDYGMFHNARDNEKYKAVIGCRIVQNIGALNGGPKDGAHNNHGPIRIARCRNVIFAQLDLFSRAGWSNLAPDRADQPCIRLNSSTGGPENEAVFDRVVAEGGFRIISLEGQNGNEEEYAGNYLMDRMLLIGTAKTAACFIRLEFGGTTVRNVVGMMPDVPEYHNNWVGAFHLNIDVVNATNRDAPIRIHNNTFVNMQSDANDKGNAWPIWGEQPFGNMFAENNVLHAPNIGAGAVTSDGPIDFATALVGVSPRYAGIGYDNGPLDTTYDSPATLPSPRPEEGSAAIDSGDAGLKAYLDFAGAVRPTVGNERGALLEG